MAIEIGSKVRHVSGAWECGCDDTDGEVTKLSDGTEFDEDEPMAFVGTPCGWGWLPVSELKPADDGPPLVADLMTTSHFRWGAK
jgi:hypothetical protein